jgi:hypothetical protein
MPAKSVPLGPGTISIGEIATPVDFSCQLVHGVVEWDKDKDDDIVVLCGETVPGSITYTATISGNILQDLDDPAGIVFYSWDHKGEQVPFTYVPNTEVGAEITGIVTLDPIAVGSDEPRAKMASDFSWDFVGEPALAPGTVLAAASAETGDE